MSIGPGYVHFPHGYEAPNGVEGALPGVADDAGSRDPSSTTVDGAVSNAMAQCAEMAGDIGAQGAYVGDLINLPALSDK